MKIRSLLSHPLSASALYLFLRAVLSPLSPIPGGVVLDPLWLFMTLRGDQGKGSRAALLLPGLLLGDWMAGLGPWVMGLRVLGLLSVLGTEPPGRGLHARWLHGALFHGLWTAWAVEITGAYPLVYVFVVVWVQSLLWWGIGAPASGGGPLPPWRTWIWVPLTLGVAHFVFFSPSFWPPPHLGQDSGWGIRVTGGLVALLPWGAVFWRMRTPGTPPRSRTITRWSELAEKETGIPTRFSDN